MPLTLQIPTISIQPARICMGGCDFGTTIPREQVFQILDLYVELGGNFIDTAHIYAAWIPGGEGVSERVIGEWSHARGNRSALILATKGAHPPLDDMSRGRCSADCIRQDLTESLERLGVEWIDLYWLHRDEVTRPVEEIISTLEELVREGLIRSYGASNWTWQRLEAANAFARSKGYQGFTASQPGWALADYAIPPPEMQLLFIDPPNKEYHQRSGLPVVPYSAQAKGYFGKENTAWAQAGFAGQAPRAKEYDAPQNRMRLIRSIDLAKKYDCSPNQIALSYLISQPFPVYPIISTSNPAHLREAIGAEQLRLTVEECTWLERGDSYRSNS